jgi:hypothetical protein
MQTLSSMRRNSTYHRVVVPIGLFLLALIYASLSSMTLYLTPLLGVGFYYIITYADDKKRYFELFLISLYSLYVEIDRGLVIFSFLIFTLLFYKFIFRSFKKFLYCPTCLVVSYVTIGYLGYFAFNLFASYVLDKSLPIFSLNYLIYIVSDIMFVLVFL